MLDDFEEALLPEFGVDLVHITHITKHLLRLDFVEKELVLEVDQAALEQLEKDISYLFF